MIDELECPSIGTCHECLQVFELKGEYLVGHCGNYPIWECPHCAYPNSKEDCIA